MLSSLFISKAAGTALYIVFELRYNGMVMKDFKKRYLIPLIKTILFMLVVFLIVGNVQYLLQYRERHNDNSSFQIINFYKEDKNAMDAVFIGSSCTFSYYSPLLAYKSHGLKTTNYSSSGMGMLAYRYAIEEVRKTQKDALIVLTVTPSEEMQYLGVHFMADYMPLSMNKVRFLTRYFTQDGESILNSIGFYFTLMEFHDRWAEVTKDDLVIDEGIKGATRHHYYLETINDISEYCETETQKLAMPKQMEYLMNDLLDYCDAKKENIVFLFPPKAYTAEEYGEMNTLTDLIRERGYEVLDLRDQFDELHLDIKQDFYDIDHTNIHGSIRYTDYLARYVMKKRECTLGSDAKWDEAVNKYDQIIKNNVLDIETDMIHHDYAMDKPQSLDAQVENGNVSLTWSGVDEADRYFVYRKTDGGFLKIGETSELSFTDKNVDKNVYTYTVLSLKEENGEMIYGNYDYRGVKVEVNK